MEGDAKHMGTGMALILNMSVFHNSENGERKGSDKDADDLHRELNRKGFKVRRFDNLKSKELMDRLTKAQRDENHRKSDCFLLAVLSHGGKLPLQHQPKHGIPMCEDIIFTTDRGWIQIKTILEYFTDKSCPSLRGKPRIFLIQACRGTAVDAGIKTYTVQTITDDEVDGTVKYIHKPCPSFKDFLIVNSTQAGHYSFRNRFAGSYFIQAIIQELSAVEVKIEVHSLMTKVLARVALNFESCTDERDTNRKKQMPSMNSTLTMMFYLRNKETEV